MCFLCRITEKWISSALSQNSELNMISILLEKGISREQLQALVVDFMIGGVDTVCSISIGFN